MSHPERRPKSLQNGEGCRRRNLPEKADLAVAGPMRS